MKEIKIPTIEDYLNHTGLHYKKLWNEIGDDWICPACKRSKFQIMHWTKRFPSSKNPFMDWVASLHRHHDHFTNYACGIPRFPQTVICGQCNSADGAAKRGLKLPKTFSFSPNEISQFVSSAPHCKHEISLEIASTIYLSIFKTKEL